MSYYQNTFDSLSPLTLYLFLDFISREEKIFYVLNPDKNLAKTQARLEPTLAEMSIGSGIVGEQPSLPQMRKVFSEMDAYLYIGHGSTLKNFSSQEIEKLNIRAVSLLFGCNSGKLERMGRTTEPIGKAGLFYNV